MENILHIDEAVEQLTRSGLRFERTSNGFSIPIGNKDETVDATIQCGTEFRTYCSMSLSFGDASSNHNYFRLDFLEMVELILGGHDVAGGFHPLKNFANSLYQIDLNYDDRPLKIVCNATENNLNRLPGSGVKDLRGQDT